MKSSIKKVLLVVALLVLLAMIFLPTSYRVERSTTIHAPAEDLFAMINTLQEWPTWTAWTVAKYPDMKLAFSGPEMGVGAIYSWEGKDVGQGKLKIFESDPERGIKYDLAFDNGKYISQGSLVLEKSGDGVKVTWSNWGELGWNPIGRVFGLLMDRMMGPDFETGLANLKQRAEGTPDTKIRRAGGL